MDKGCVIYDIYVQVLGEHFNLVGINAVQDISFFAVGISCDVTYVMHCVATGGLTPTVGPEVYPEGRTLQLPLPEGADCPILCHIVL